MYTKGPDKPIGLDGIGPVATWYEGTLSYICAQGSGSQMLFDSLVNYRLADGTIPAYNDNIGSLVDIWAVNWSSLDATLWLYFAAAKGSPFKIYYHAPNIPESVEPIRNSPTLDIFPNPSEGIFHFSFGNTSKKINYLAIYDQLGVCILQRTNLGSEDPISIDLSKYKSGIYLLVANFNNEIVSRKFELIH